MEELSDGGGLSDGDNSLPPRHKHYVRHVQEALQNTLQDLAQLQEQVVPEPIRENLKKQQQALTRLLNGWQRRRGDPDGNVPLSPMGRGVEFTKEQRRRLGEALRTFDERRRRTLRGLQFQSNPMGNLRHAATAANLCCSAPLWPRCLPLCVMYVLSNAPI